MIGTEVVLAFLAAGDVLLKRLLFGKVDLAHQGVWQRTSFKLDFVLVVVLGLLTTATVLKTSLWSEELDLWLLMLRCLIQVCRILAYFCK